MQKQRWTLLMSFMALFGAMLVIAGCDDDDDPPSAPPAVVQPPAPAPHPRRNRRLRLRWCSPPHPRLRLCSRSWGRPRDRAAVWLRYANGAP